MRINYLLLAISLTLLPGRAGPAPLAAILAEAKTAALQGNETLLRAKTLEAIYGYPAKSDTFLLLGELTKAEGDRNPKPELARQSYILAFASYQRAFEMEPQKGDVEKKITELHLLFNRKFPGRALASIRIQQKERKLREIGP